MEYAHFNMSVGMTSATDGGAMQRSAYSRGVDMLLKMKNSVKHYRYRNKADEVLSSHMLLPDGAPEKFQDPQVCWQELADGERQANAQHTRKIDIAIPKEISALGKNHMEALAKTMFQKFVDEGSVVEFSIQRADGLFDNNALFSELDIENGEWFDEENLTQNFHIHAQISQKRCFADGFERTKEFARNHIDRWWREDNMKTARGHFSQSINEFAEANNVDCFVTHLKHANGEKPIHNMPKRITKQIQNWREKVAVAKQNNRPIPEFPKAAIKHMKLRDADIAERLAQQEEEALLQASQFSAEYENIENKDITNDRDRATDSTDATDRGPDRGLDGIDGGADGIDGPAERRIDDGLDGYGTDEIDGYGSDRDGERVAEFSDSDDLIEQLNNRRSRLDERVDDESHRAIDEHGRGRQRRDGRDADHQSAEGDFLSVRADDIRAETDEYAYGSAAIEHDAVARIATANANKSAQRSREVRSACNHARRPQQEPQSNQVERKGYRTYIYRAFSSSLLKYSARREQRRAERLMDKLLIEMALKAVLAALSFLFKILGNPSSVLSGEAFEVIPAAFKSDIRQKQQRIDRIYQNKETTDLLKDIINQPVVYEKKLDEATISEKWAFYLQDKTKEVERTKKWQSAASSAREFEAQKRAYKRLCQDVQSGKFSQDDLHDLFAQNPDMIFAEEIIFDVYDEYKKEGIDMNPHDKPKGVSHRDYINQKYAEHHRPKNEFNVDNINKRDFDDDDDYGNSGFHM